MDVCGCWGISFVLKWKKHMEGCIMSQRQFYEQCFLIKGYSVILNHYKAVIG